MLPSWYLYIILIIVFNLVNAHERLSTDKQHDRLKKNITRNENGLGKKGVRHESETEPTEMIEDEHTEVVEDESSGPLDAKPEHYISDSAFDYKLYSTAEVVHSQEHEYYDGVAPAQYIDPDKDQSGVAPAPYIDSDNDQNDGPQARALESGDTFTPLEMLPISIKLYNKVDNPGEGAGIVSSVKTPEELADKLFAAYFLTSRRIVYLTDNDLSGLDALQALALEGDAVKIRMGGDPITEAPYKMVNFRGQLIGVKERPERCHYKLLKKPVEDSKSKKLRRDGIKLNLEKKLRPNRHLVINAHRARKLNKIKKMRMRAEVDKRAENKEDKDGKKDLEKGAEKEKEIERKSRHRKRKGHMKLKKRKSKQRRKRRQKKGGKRNKKSRMKQRKYARSKLDHLRNINRAHGAQLTTTRQPACKWKYLCKNPGDLDTCRLHTSCIDETGTTSKYEDIFIDHNEDEHSETVKQFRKMMGITLIDEEVEKIIEHHILLIRPQSVNGVARIETLEEYFNNIMRAQQGQTTDPGPTGRPHLLQETSISNTPQISSSDSEDPSESVEEAMRAAKKKATNATLEAVKASQPNGRKILGLPKIHTTKPRRK